MDKELKEIIVAGYLHDVGKFAQRADRKEFYDKTLESIYCKLQKGGYYGYQHVVYTHGFLEKYKNLLPNGLDASKIIQLAVNHHNPSTYEEWIVAQGDRLSSGSDRCNILGVEDSENPSLQNDNPAKFYEKPLIHILSTLKIGGRKSSERSYCTLKPLDGDAILSVSSDKIGKEDYGRLWELFEKDFTALEGLDFEDFVSALDSLCERYWWCIPSATNVDADISLYQHAKTTVAFASALYNFQKVCQKESEIELRKDDEKKFLFIKGDVSGIQKYIFALKSNDDSAKLLRAKSFQIAAVGDIIAKNIVSRLDLPASNIITSAGGDFMLLLPDTDKVKQLLPQIQLEAESYFLNEFAGNLSIIISDGVEASFSDIQQKNAQHLINDIGHAADICKQKKMQKALQKNGAILNEYYDALQKNGECPKCGVFASAGKNADGSAKECENCTSLTEIGGELVKSSWLKYSSDKLLHFGQMVKASKRRGEKGFSSINTYVPGFSVSHLPYSAPQNADGSLTSFADIAKKSTGNKKLAMFKADIDNLGLVFSSSLGERTSFSRYADMSHKLHYFFSTYYTYFLSNFSCQMTDENGEKLTVPYKDLIYTVFSGGDDLCVLGAWDAVVQFASDFQKEIKKLTNNNPSLTLSAGIALANPGTPVSMIAESAERALEASKSLTEDGKKDSKIVKNAITIFGTTVSWEDYNQSLDDGKKLRDYLDSGVFSTGIVYKMIDFSRRTERILAGNVTDILNLKNHTWKSNFKYIVVRNVADEKAKEWLLKFGSSPDKMRKSRIAVSYALYTQRKN